MARLMSARPFSGSYRTGEVQFLLQPMQMHFTPLEERERLIQSGQRHYSEMIGPEDAPSRERIALFRECFARNSERFASDIALLADALHASVENASAELTIVSIARAGTPVGVLLSHRLRALDPELKLAHYSISVIRDRGVDFAALAYILKRHAAESIRFVDGWTGKGTIASELQTSIAAWTDAPARLDTSLWVPLDICGVAGTAASECDYIIPSCLLGATVSGLVSRSILPVDKGFGREFHGCVQLQFRRYDLSRWFVDQMLQKLNRIDPAHANYHQRLDSSERREVTRRCLTRLLDCYFLSDPNRIKLGIGETARVLLRRLPEVVLLGAGITKGDADLLSRLASLRGVRVIYDSELAFCAAAIIGTPAFRSEALKS